MKIERIGFGTWYDPAGTGHGWYADYVDLEATEGKKLTSFDFETYQEAFTKAKELAQKFNVDIWGLSAIYDKNGRKKQ